MIANANKEDTSGNYSWNPVNIYMGGFSHTVLLSGVGFDPLPNEEVILPTLSDNI